MSQLDALLAGIVKEPLEETRWLVLADWLQEYDDPLRAEFLRLHRQLIATCCDARLHQKRAAWQSRLTALLVAGVKPCVPTRTVLLPGGVPLTLAHIPPGTFRMGSGKGDPNERPIHQLEVRTGFYMGIVPVTQAQWAAVCGTRPSYFRGAQRPVEYVTWDECAAFCVKLGGLLDERVSLPTEMQWEYACRAGTLTEFAVGNELGSHHANHDRKRFPPKSPADDGTTVVGSFPPNAWGLHDMHGNVWEWCATKWQRYPLDKDWNYETTEQERIARGGAWSSYPDECRSAFRRSLRKERRSNDVGFRICIHIA